MRIKVFIIACLSCAILASAAVGTLSSYTLSTGGRVGIEPDTKKMQKQNDTHRKQLHLETAKADSEMGPEPGQSLRPVPDVLEEGTGSNDVFHTGAE